MLRRTLDALYRTSEALAACCIFAIFAMILAQVGLGLADRIFAALGLPPLRLSIPSYAEFAAYLLAAASFLGLAGALRAGAHVRVSLLIGRLSPGLRRASEVAVGALATLVAGYFCWRAGLMVHQSWLFGDRSYGLVSIPMWVPQMPMALGLGVLTLAFADLTLAAATGRPLPDEGRQD